MGFNEAQSESSWPSWVGTIEDIVFDESGRLFGVAATNPSSLVRIDTLTGVATLIGSMGVGSVIALAAEGALTGIDEDEVTVQPTRYELLQNYPNPFNPSTTIRYGLPSRSHITLTVFNTLGQQVASWWVASRRQDTTRSVRREISSGVYFYRIQAGSFVETRKLLLMK